MATTATTPTQRGAGKQDRIIADGQTGERGPRPVVLDATASALMAAARREIDDTLATLTRIRDDEKQTGSARVAASRTIAEIAGTIGRERTTTAAELAKKAMDQMSAVELQTAAEQGRNAQRQMITMMPTVELRDFIAFAQAVLATRSDDVDPLS